MDKLEVSNERMREVLEWAHGQGRIGATADTVTNNEGQARELLNLDVSDTQINFTNGVFSVDSGATNLPCTGVTWFGAQAYCNYRSSMENREPCIDFADWSCDFSKNGYRLPTEAEWEKAARGGLAGQHYPWPSIGGSYSNHIDGSRANYANSGGPYDNDRSPVGYYDGNQTPSGVDMANGFGLYDMAGNVWEWCYDWYDANWYSDPDAEANDTTGPDTGTERVLRGGSWHDGTVRARCANRSWYRPVWTFATPNGVGFRAAKGL